MPRNKFRPKVRQSNVIDPKLIVIATEGEYSERQYFEELRLRFGRSSIHVEILNTTDNKSSPQHVLRRLDEFRKKYQIKRKRDELWMAIDYDRWGQAKLSEIAQLCEQKGFNLAVSNPCFELWLLLHLRKLNSYSMKEQENFLLNRRIGKRTPIEKVIVDECGEYNKTRINMAHFSHNIRGAIEEARRIDNPDLRWPEELGSRLFLIVEEIIGSPYAQPKRERFVGNAPRRLIC